MVTDFTKGPSKDWKLAAGTTLTYDPQLGAAFTIDKAGKAPTISMNKYIMFGRLEVVMRASFGTGTVSSLVLQSADLDEIDWEWLGADHNNVQTNFFGKGNTTTYDRGGKHPVSDPMEEFHTYTIDWTAQSLKWLINGQVIREVPYADPKALYGQNYPQTPMEIKMGSWIGCASEEAAKDPKTSGTCEWTGGPIDFSKGPYIMYVKSVKVTDYSCASEYVYGDMSGSYQSIKKIGGCEGGSAGSEPSGDKSSSGTASATGSKTITSSATQSSSTGPAILIETSVSVQTSTRSNATATFTTSSATRSSTPSSTSSSLPANGASGLSPKKYGVLDVGVVALGLAMGYFFM